MSEETNTPVENTPANNPVNISVNVPAQQQNGLAVAGFVLSLVGLFCFGFIVEVLAIIFSGIALSKCKNPAVPHKGLAIAGLVIGIIGFISSLFWIGTWLSLLGIAASEAQM